MTILHNLMVYVEFDSKTSIDYETSLNTSKLRVELLFQYLVRFCHKALVMKHEIQAGTK